jgi:hypothetical protein
VQRCIIIKGPLCAFFYARCPLPIHLWLTSDA